MATSSVKVLHILRAMSDTISLAQYLFTRLRQLGICSIFGVPGDYNLTLLDHLFPSELRWIGNCNELNAGYAADGYARVKGLGALVTTFGVGELSALNAIAGAYAELVPVVHIVGTPSRDQQDCKAPIHHTLLDGDFSHFSKMYEHVTIAQANLNDPRTCISLVDSALEQCLLQSRPVYIQVPVDMVSTAVCATNLNSPIQIPRHGISSTAAEALCFVARRMRNSKRPMILVDGESATVPGMLDAVHELVKRSAWPTWTSVFGKSCVDESLPNVLGVWKGPHSREEEREYIESTDLVLCFGPHFSGTNTHSFSTVPKVESSILVKRTSVHVGDQIFRDIDAAPFISAMLRELPEEPKRYLQPSMLISNTPLDYHPQKVISQDKFYRYLAAWVQLGDVVLAETGTAGHGCRDMKLPPAVRLLKPATWLSIGYMLPAAVGAGLAQRDIDSNAPSIRNSARTILLIGDGAFQMTAQEMSTVIREELNMLMILINNDGYTIERCIHGWKASYNDIASWRYLQAPAFFGVQEDTANATTAYRARTSQVKTWKDLQVALDAWSRSTIPSLHMIEVMMDREDAPIALTVLLEEQKLRESG